ncbi:gamma-glutamyltransferase family protein [Conexibacter sp. CPCC 206217]|uniref:gamma-glutamyltransferase family protein n=1 Tax=Conexibacter sp. CPCC 206217 TaxID=3064574 RepID=UPI002728F01D|nr:gamma-glutamyltransferase [Conexibacter sp. CPCC 206217]MDO8212452.1 gamma-glutamyltransferase [Conexibacter sp. CPCC 206217]
MSEYAIATPQLDATAAGVAAFDAGGNAIDAALAAAATLCVTYPHNVALGGDLFALVRTPAGETTSVNASGPAGRAADAETLRRRICGGPTTGSPRVSAAAPGPNAKGSGAREREAGRPEARRRDGAAMPTYSPDAITVPGLVAGWEALHGLGATRSWADTLGAAIGHAADGFAVGRSLAAAIDAARGALDGDPGLRALFVPGGRQLVEGDTLRQPALASTLQTLAAEGPRAFYEGALAERLITGLRRAGCSLDTGDLAAFGPELTAPLRHRCGDLDLLTSPPNSSGVLLLQALAALSSAGVPDPLGADAAVLAELLRLGAQQRDDALGDPRAVSVELEAWLGSERIARLAEAALARVADGAGAADVAGSDVAGSDVAGSDVADKGAAGTGASAAAQTARGERSPHPDGDTIAIVAVDGEGRAVSLIQSVFHSFGARLLEPETGVLMHNRGSFFSLVPGHPNELAPGRRPAHTLMPVMVESDGELRHVLGTMGGKAHAQIHAQVLLRLLAGEHPQAAVASPRWIVGGADVGDPDDTVLIEDDVTPAARASLQAAGMRLVPAGTRSERCGHAQAIAFTPTGLQAGSDPRADGAAVVGSR